MSQFIIHGGKKLNGSISVNSAKNSAVAIIVASLINRGVTTLKNVPRIEEVERLVEVLESIGVSVSRRGKTMGIRPPKKFTLEKINRPAAKKTRGIILAIGALAGQLTGFNLPIAGGCRLGSRTVKPHLFALENFGISIKTTSGSYKISRLKLRPAEFVLYETGDTVTENVILAAAQIPAPSVIRMASANYMVQDLCVFLKNLGVAIQGLGTSTLKIKGKKNIRKNITYSIGEDPIEAMFYLAAAVTTSSRLKIKRCPLEFLELELLKLRKMGLKYKIIKTYKGRNGQIRLADLEIFPSALQALEDKIHAMPFPGINQDNLPFFVPIATQAAGQTLIHDWTYENRAIYYNELNRLGAKITLMDPHRVTIDGPSQLTAAELICPPALRPAAIILVAMLAAKGKSILRNVYPIHRGYERLEERLRSLGADIKLVED